MTHEYKIKGVFILTISHYYLATYCEPHPLYQNNCTPESHKPSTADHPVYKNVAPLAGKTHLPQVKATHWARTSQAKTECLLEMQIRGNHSEEPRRGHQRLGKCKQRSIKKRWETELDGRLSEPRMEKRLENCRDLEHSLGDELPYALRKPTKTPCHGSDWTKRLAGLHACTRHLPTLAAIGTHRLSPMSWCTAQDTNNRGLISSESRARKTSELPLRIPPAHRHPNSVQSVTYIFINWMARGACSSLGCSFSV
jgi:hypothetical protein